jgi:hypothetical protein
VTVTNANLVNTEVLPTGSRAVARIYRATVDVTNLTNQTTTKPLLIKADAYVENKAHVDLTLSFEYNRPQFTFDVTAHTFNLPDLNSLIKAYTPASV